MLKLGKQQLDLKLFHYLSAVFFNAISVAFAISHEIEHLSKNSLFIYARPGQ